MATLFRNFSFNTPSPSLVDHEAERAYMNCSPTSVPTTSQHSYSRPLTPPPCTIGDLAQLMSGQNLYIDTSRSQDTPAGPPTPPSEDDTFPVEQLDRQTPGSTYCRASASIIRMQRQANSRLQCCSLQARDIAKLVRMVEQEEQCSISEPVFRPASTSFVELGDDEGIDLDFDCSLRVTEPVFSRPPYRAGDRHNDGARVSKNVRMRKRSSAAKDVRERRKTR